ncbi:MAG: response regulator [Archaeoglobus sp.]|nr:response regulator [Archaeoglobus sp.]
MAKVLIVDDDITVRDVLKVMLNGHVIVEATNGSDAVKYFKIFKPDIVLMDVMMPEMDGVQATKKILEIDPNAKIIAITAFASSKGQEMLDAGSVAVLEKPFTRKSINELIGKYVGPKS